jgi:large subunit ribosomal protein L6
MKTKVEEKIAIPEGVTCSYENNLLECKKDSKELSRKLEIPKVEVKVDSKEVTLICPKASKKEMKSIKSNVSHIKNIFSGLEETYTYELESCNVHFPMNIKAESDQVVITNFLGETVPRKARILPDVDVQIKGAKITVASIDKESAGQTAANLENATRVKGRDKRVFQDGIYITKKPGAKL